MLKSNTREIQQISFFLYVRKLEWNFKVSIQISTNFRLAKCFEYQSEFAKMSFKKSLCCWRISLYSNPSKFVITLDKNSFSGNRFEKLLILVFYCYGCLQGFGPITTDALWSFCICNQPTYEVCFVVQRAVFVDNRNTARHCKQCLKFQISCDTCDKFLET